MTDLTREGLADLADNMDVTRLGRIPTDADRQRLDRYFHARGRLMYLATTGATDER